MRCSASLSTLLAGAAAPRVERAAAAEEDVGFEDFLPNMISDRRPETHAD
jgi:hypothetical protein